MGFTPSFCKNFFIFARGNIHWGWNKRINFKFKFNFLKAYKEDLKAETVQTETVLVWQVRLRNLRFKVRASAAFLAELPRLDGAWLWCG